MLLLTKKTKKNSYLKKYIYIMSSIVSFFCLTAKDGKVYVTEVYSI